MSHEVIIICHFIGVVIHQHDSTKYDFNKSFLEYNYEILLLVYPNIYFLSSIYSIELQVQHKNE